MLTKIEMQNILDQVNSRFDFLSNRLDKIEKVIQAKRTTQPVKKVEEKA